MQLVGWSVTEDKARCKVSLVEAKLKKRKKEKRKEEVQCVEEDGE